MLRICRICLTSDICNSFKKCFDDNGKLASEVYALFQVSVVSLNDDPAIICRKCEKHIMQARELQKLVINAEKHFQTRLTNQRFLWNENLREMKGQGDTYLSLNSMLDSESVNDDLNTADLEDFIEKADDFLTKSFEDIEKTSKTFPYKVPDAGEAEDSLYQVESNNKNLASDNNEEDSVYDGVEVKIERISLADTEILFETLDDRISTDFNECDELLNISQEDLMIMTAAIEDILPKEIIIDASPEEITGAVTPAVNGNKRKRGRPTKTNQSRGSSAAARSHKEKKTMADAISRPERFSGRLRNIEK